jgi:Thiol:disulfide interchange protein
MKELKRVFLILFVACLFGQVKGQDTNTNKGMAVEPEGTLFNQAVQKAKQLNKLVFLDCYTSWCGPCKMMASKVFPQEVVGNFMNPKYVCIKINMEQGEGVALAKKFQISAYPTFIIFNGNGQEIGRFLGGCPAEEFIKKVQTASIDNGSAEMDKRFADGDRSEEFLLSYLKTLSSAYKRDQCNAVTEELLKGKEKTFAASKLLAEMFMRNINNPFCPAFIYTAKHPEKLIETLGEVPVRMKLNSVWAGYGRYLLVDENGKKEIDTDKLEKWIKLMKECNVENREEIRLSTLINITGLQENWDAYIGYINEYWNNPTLDVTDLSLCKWCTPILRKCKEKGPRHEALVLLQKRLGDLESGKRLPQTKQGNMTLSGDLNKAMKMIIDELQKD